MQQFNIYNLSSMAGNEKLCNKVIKRFFKKQMSISTSDEWN